MYTSNVKNVSDVNCFSIVDNVSIVKYLDLPIKKKNMLKLPLERKKCSFLIQD